MIEAKQTSGQTLRAMTTAALVELLQKSGSKKATLESVNRLLQEGAPLNADGTVDLIRFMAYLEGRRNGKL